LGIKIPKIVLQAGPNAYVQRYVLESKHSATIQPAIWFAMTATLNCSTTAAPVFGRAAPHWYTSIACYLKPFL